MNTEVAPSGPVAPWRDRPYVLSWNNLDEVPHSVVRSLAPRGHADTGPPWFDSGPPGESFHFTRAMADLTADVCRHVAEFQHIDPNRVLITMLQARHPKRHGLQARVTPLRFTGGHLVKTSRGRAAQVQRIVVGGVEMLYVMTFCLPRFLDRPFAEKMITLFHELYHIGPAFDGDLRRHGGRCSLHTHSKANYDAHMADLARAYLGGGANPRRHEFLRFTCAQLQARHGRVIGAVVPRVKIIPLPLS